MKNSRGGSGRLHGCVVALLMGVGMPASAATHVVTTTADSGPGSLRQAMTQAIASPEDDGIVFDPAADGVITLQSALPDLLASGGDLTLTGNGAARTIIDGAGEYRLLQARDQSNWHLALRALTLRNASSGAELYGGAVLMQGGSNAALTIDGVEFVDNFATQHGAAIYAHATMHIENSLIVGSQLSGFFVGGTLFCADAPLFMRNTTIAASRVGTVSGGIAQSSLFLDGAGCTARLVNSTIVDSGAMDAIGVQNASLSLSNTMATAAYYGRGIVVSGSGTLDVAGSRNNVVSGDGNVAGLVDGVNGNRVSRAPMLAGPLGDHGGPVRTLPLLPGSPALDAGSAADADVPATDARGMTRIGAPDAGAFESRGFRLEAASFADQSTLVGTSFPDHLEFQVSALDPGEPVEGGHIQLIAPATGASATVLRVRQVIDASGHASLLLRANDEAGGPYTVAFTVNSAAAGDPLPEVRLDNRALQCGSHGDTYAVAGADNHARLSNLREAMHCGNQTGQPAIIDLGQQTLVFEDGPYESLEIEGSFGALPPLTRTIELRNGALERNPLSPETFRFIEGTIGAGLTLDGISMANGNGTPFGGAVYTVRSGVIRILDSRFIDNASGSGGALYLQSDESAELANSRFTGNQSTRNGGAAWVYSAGGSSVHDSHFEDNHASDRGGALHVLSIDPNDLHGNVFAANTAGAVGGAISGDRLEIAATLFRGNHAVDGGAIHSNARADSSYPLRVSSSVFAQNSAERFPVLYVPRAAPTFIDNVTVVGNAATVGSTLFGIDDTTTDPVATHVRNSIIWNNPGLTCGDALLERSLVEGGDAGGTGIIDADPRFVDAANGDWRLGADSPAIDAGDNAFVASGATDRDGLPRRFDDPAVADTGAGTAPIVDLGAYERQTGIGACADFTFPYIVSGADNAARVAELRQAIECANANATDDEIDLGGNTLVVSDAPYTDANGANALPIVTGTLILGNGALERDASAPAFRFLDVATAGNLTVRAMQLRNGQSGSEGGAIRADGELALQDSVFEDNVATLGGAISSHAMTTIATSRFTRNAALDGAAIAGGDGDAIPGGDVTIVFNSRFEDNGDGASRSVIWNKSYFGMIGSLVAGNHLAAAGSSLMFFHDDNAVAELRNVTIAGNAVQGDVFSRALSNVQLHNVIVWDNQYGSLGNASPTNSILPGVPAVNGNLDQPPGFVGTPGDYHLDAGSPAIDAGDNSYGGAGEDLDMNPRPVDDAGVADTGNGTAPLVDIGAYEYQADSVVAGITVTPSSGLVTTEAGGSATFTVVLDRYPTAAVALSLASSNVAEGAVVPASLSFTPENWNQPRTVTVTGVDDGLIDGDQGYTINIGAADSDDPAYDGIDPLDVSVVNQDDEAPTHGVGGTVTGLIGSGLVLSLGAETLPLAANGSFAFTTLLPPGDAYSVAVTSQPHDPVQACVVINGNGTMGTVDIGNVVVNCGASVTYAVGGTVTGLAGGGLTLQLNGGGDLPVSADGSYAFAPRLIDGAGYVVTVRTQPQGQLCTLANASGTVQGADVIDVDVGCAPLQANLQLGVDDGHVFARYGHVRDYFVTLGNTGNAAATGVAIAATFSAAFDVPNVHWQCIGGGGGASCGSAGAGGFTDSANVPANSSVTWIVSVPVLAGSNESEATFTVGEAAPVHAPAGTSLPDAADTDTLVLFRDGYDVPYGDGTQALDDAESSSLQGERSLPIEWLPAGGDGIRVVRVLQTPDGTVEVQRLGLGGPDFVRLLGTDAIGQQQASDWASVVTGARLIIGHVASEGGAGIVLLEGAARPLALPQRASDNNGEIE